MPRMAAVGVGSEVQYSTIVSSNSVLSEFHGMGQPLVPIATCDIKCVGVVKWHKSLSLTMFGCENGSVHISDGDSFMSFKGHDGENECICDFPFQAPILHCRYLNPECVHEGHLAPVHDGVFSNDGSLMYTISKRDPRILRWDLKSEGRPKVLQRSVENPLDLHGYGSITLDEGRAEVIALRLVEGLASRTLVVVFDMHSGKILREYKGRGCYYDIWAGVITPTNCIYTGKETNVLYFDIMINRANVDGSNDHILQNRSHMQLVRGYIECMTLSADKTKLAVGTSLASVLLFAVSTDMTGPVLRKFQTYYGHCRVDVNSPHKQREQCSCATDTASQKCSFISHRDVVYNVEFDSSDKRVISFSNGYVLERNGSHDSDPNENITELWVPFDAFGEVPGAARRRKVFRVPKYTDLVATRRANLQAAAMAFCPRLGVYSMLGEIEPSLLRMIADFI